MTFDALMKDLKAGKYKPVYLLQGEEEYFLDLACEFFEHQLLSETERDFNLTVFYGKDADWSEVINACQRYPMFSEKQVVILKEAQGMKKDELERITGYLEDPQRSTIFVLILKGGKLDGRLKMSQLIKKSGVIFESKKIYENKLPGWIRSYTASKGYEITDKACMMMANHIGMDLSVQTNEIGKVILNLPKGSKIDDQAIEKFVGISREYNVFEFQKALGKKDVPKMMSIIRYFEGNPKAAPLQLLLPIIYGYFAKLDTLIQYSRQLSGNELARAVGVPFFFLREYQQSAKLYGEQGVKLAILHIYDYTQRMVGIGDNNTGQPGLLKELIAKILQD